MTENIYMEISLVLHNPDQSASLHRTGSEIGFQLSVSRPATPLCIQTKLQKIKHSYVDTSDTSDVTYTGSYKHARMTLHFTV